MVVANVAAFPADRKHLRRPIGLDWQLDDADWLDHRYIDTNQRL
jgi:hypothetical protein